MRWRWSMLWKVAAGTVVLGVVAAMVAAPFVCSHIHNVVLDAYAQTWASDALIDHMERNGGRWPRSWDELEDSFEVIAGRYGRLFSYADIQSRIAIDWNVDPKQLALASSTDEPPCRAVWLRNGKQHYWEGAEPNARIVDYFRHRKDDPSSDQPPSRLDVGERQARQALLKLGAQFEIDRAGHVVTVNMGSPVATPLYADADLQHLASLKNLQGLNIGYSNIGNEGLKHLRGLAQLEWLYLYGTKVDDDGLTALEGLPNLKVLTLADDNFSDAGMPHVAKMGGLQTLNLNRTRITDAGLVHLAGLANLTEVMLYDTRVSDEAVQKLQAALPNCKVSR